MKSVIVLREELASGLLANAAACITSGLFKGEEMVYGSEIEGDFFKYIPITKIPILITKKHDKSWKELLNRAKKNKLKYVQVPIATIYADKYKGTTVFDGIKIVSRMIWWRLQ